ncbi:unnamed protein product [Danaus chrysippus]|uniref:(African queen) hypothetical protein n=1 Tax=Danaus chrysippus TaxID=151541 RepID=A0A8J2WFR3_9NEOP|nr:unnamed protein product [Danaus chrysippus]
MIWFCPICRSSVSPIPSGTLPRPGTKQVTVTVQETVVEPAQPPPPQPQATTVRHHHASSATKELDDLMASLSDFKHGYFQWCEEFAPNISRLAPARGDLAAKDSSYYVTGVVGPWD